MAKNLIMSLCLLLCLMSCDRNNNLIYDNDPDTNFSIPSPTIASFPGLNICVLEENEPDLLFVQYAYLTNVHPISLLLHNLLFAGDIVRGHYWEVYPIVELVDVSVNEIEVEEGEYYFGSVFQHEGDPIIMPQYSIRFRIINDVFWPDGERVSATDSIFAYWFFSNDFSRHTDYYAIERYMLINEYEILWVGAPNYFPEDPLHEFWVPLPEHLMRDINPQALLDAISRYGPNEYLYSFGPFYVEQWDYGTIMSLERNERNNSVFGYILEGINTINIHFVDSLEENNDCEIIVDDDFDLEAFFAHYNQTRK